MYENAQEIFGYLPIRRNTPENDYISHLWQAFMALDAGDELAKRFAVMPFHLLFMLAVQYKVLRISRERKTEYEMAFTLNHGRNHEILLSPKSVFDLALLNERSLPDLLKLVGLNIGGIDQIKKLVDNRNINLAHAQGGSETDPEGRIEEYLAAIDTLQSCMRPLNDFISDAWVGDFSPDDNKADFIEARLLDSMFCPEDFKTGKLADNFAKYLI